VCYVENTTEALSTCLFGAKKKKKQPAPYVPHMAVTISLKNKKVARITAIATKIDLIIPPKSPQKSLTANAGASGGSGETTELTHVYVKAPVFISYWMWIGIPAVFAA